MHNIFIKTHMFHSFTVIAIVLECGKGLYFCNFVGRKILEPPLALDTTITLLTKLKLQFQIAI